MIELLLGTTEDEVKKAEEDTELYYIFTNNVFLQTNKIDERFKESIKYFNIIDKELQKSNPIEMSDKAWDRYLIENGLETDNYHRHLFEFGLYHDHKMGLLVYIYGPFTKNEIKN